MDAKPSETMNEGRTRDAKYGSSNSLDNDETDNIRKR